MVNKGSSTIVRHLVTRAISGPISYRRYAVVVVLVAMVASLVARTGFPWTLPIVTALAVPATSRRLRTIGLPRWPAALVVVPPIAPVVVALLLVGARSTETRASRAGDEVRARVEAAGIAIATTVAIGLGLAFLSTNVMHSYGWAVFVTLPFVLGLVATVAYAADGRRSLGDALTITVLSFTVVSLALLLSALEGAVCIVMAAPLALAVGLAGAATAHLLVRAHVGARD